eukprot:4785860-Ditylum_brightwellii.AAC.1
MEDMDIILMELKGLVSEQKRGLYLLPDYEFDLLQENRRADGTCVYTSKAFLSKEQHKNLAERFGGSLDDDREGHFNSAKYVFDCAPKNLPALEDIRSSFGYIYFFNQEENTWYQHDRVAKDWGGQLASIHSDGGRRVGLGVKDWIWTDGSSWDFKQWAS